MQSIIVLGASGGLAEAFLPRAVERWGLVLQGRRCDVLSERVKALGADRAVAIEAHGAEPELPQQLWDAAVKLGQPCGLVCMVGTPGRLSDEAWSPESFADLFTVNSAVPLWHVHRWAQRMKAHGYPGNAVVLSTMQAVYPFEGSLPYALSKSGLELGVQILAKDYGPHIRVNGVAPGVNDAGMALASIQKGKYQPYIDRGIIPRYGHAEDVVEAVMFLLQPDLYMTGQTLLLDGGLTLRRDIG
ncbi:MAG TPA: SDR family oxidoreductase [Candidatus Xenobia bacterium]|jgi:NAD(P)-dependent dehydrogenase (short-subunit alcohol dehydrogenase family)